MAGDWPPISRDRLAELFGRTDGDTQSTLRPADRLLAALFGEDPETVRYLGPAERREWRDDRWATANAAGAAVDPTEGR